MGPTMRTFRVVTVACALGVVASAPGCRLVQRRGPVPPEVADTRRLCNEGLAAADRDDLVRAESLLERAVKNCPVDVEARRHYADVLWRRGEKMEAVRQAAEALRLSPDDAGLSVDAGRMYMELGLFDEADRLSRTATRLAPRSAAAWRLMGDLALARGQADTALEAFHRALAIAPTDRDVLLATADAYRRIDKPKRALATLAVLDETYGPGQTPGAVYLLEGLTQESLGRTADAIESYRQAAAAVEPSSDAVVRLAALETAAAAGAAIATRPENAAATR